MATDDSIWNLPGPGVDDSSDHAGSPTGSRRGVHIGDRLAGRFEVRRWIGQGGMGSVYEAHDTLRDEPVAVKVLLPALLEDPEAVRQFKIEASVATRLSHPNIVTVYDIHAVGETWVIVMELLEGRTLRDEIRERQAAGSGFAPDEVERLLAPLCSGLAYAHRFTVHRDIKPENVWLAADGTVKLMDFGLAKLVRGGAAPHSLRTLSQLRLGSPYYMAPEQLRDPAAVTAAADQFAAGVIAYELLAGELPIGIARPLRAVRPDLPYRLTDAVDRALSSQASDRFPSIESFQQAFRDGCASRVSWRQRLETRPRLRAAAAIAGTALLIAGFGVATAELLRRRSQSALAAGRQAQAEVHEARAGLRDVYHAFEALSGQRAAAGAALAEARAQPVPEDEDLPARLRREVAVARAEREAAVFELAWNWASPRLDGDGRPLALRERVEAIDAAARRHRYGRVASLRKGLDEAIADELTLPAALPELAESRLALSALLRPIDGAAREPARDLAAPLVDPAVAGWRPEDDDWLAALEAVRAAEQLAAEPLRGRFARLEGRHRDLVEQWRGRFPGLGAPPLEFLGFPTTKAEVAREWAALDRHDRAIPLIEEAGDIVAGWIGELEDLDARCADSWEAAVLEEREFEHVLGMRFVRIDGAYWSIWETRVMDFARFAASEDGVSLRIGDFWKHPGFRQGPTHPVVGVRHDVATAFAHWLRIGLRGHPADEASHDLPHRLRYEKMLAAEPRWAASTAKRGIFPDRNEMTSLRWFTQYADRAVDAGRFIGPVGAGEPTSHGLYDLFGNAWEWSQGFVVHDSNDQRAVYGGGTFGDVSYHGFAPSTPDTLFVGRADAIGFRIIIAADDIDMALGRGEAGP